MLHSTHIFIFLSNNAVHYVFMYVCIVICFIFHVKHFHVKIFVYDCIIDFSIRVSRSF